MCGGTHGSHWDTLGMSYVGQSCVGWWILLANLDITPKMAHLLACRQLHFMLYACVLVSMCVSMFVCG